MPAAVSPYNSLYVYPKSERDPYADIVPIAERYMAQGFAEDLAYEMAYAKCENNDDPTNH